MLKLIATTILCILIHPLWAQEVSNVQVLQNGEELKITFELSGPENEYQVIIQQADDALNFRPVGEMESRPGKNEFRKLLSEPVFFTAGVFRVSVNNINFLKDINGNKYKTIKIGMQEWMKENLKVSKYRNGDPIPTNLTDAAWRATTSGAYSIYNNDAANNATYGKLYNWYAVVDSRNLCPVGWHVPSDAEWKTLEIFLGLSASEADLMGGRGRAQNIGGKLKSTSSLYNTPNTGATNESGFSGLPGGYRYYKGPYRHVGDHGSWWSSPENSSSPAWYRSLYNTSNGSGRIYHSKQFGFSVRCLKD